MLKTFEQFINEKFEKGSKIPQLQILWTGSIGLTDKKDKFTKEANNHLYDKYIHLVCLGADKDNPNKYETEKDIPENRKGKVNYDEPILSFCGSSDTKFLKHPDAKVFNKPEHCVISGDKLLFSKKFENEDFIPKTVYDLKDIEQLQLPIIAKPKHGLSAKGIEKFDTYEDARKSKLEFDIWCECKDVEREFRAFVMDGKIIQIVERITNMENDMSVGKKKPNEKIDLIYLDQKMENFPYMDKFNKMLKALDPVLKIDFYCIDVIVDKNKDVWCPETNTSPGISPSSFYPIYKAWLKLAYNKEIDKASDDELRKISEDTVAAMKRDYPKEYKYSLHPK